jgi:Holliday junction resolvase RusA-like endonuclease
LDKNVVLLPVYESEARSENGQFRYDNAWECTVEMDRPDVDEILKEYLDELEKDFRDEKNAEQLKPKIRM